MPENRNQNTQHQAGCTCGCDPAAFAQYKKEMTVKIIISAVFFAIGYVVSEFTKAPDYVYLCCFLISYVAVGFGVIRDAVTLIASGNIFNEYLLISVVSLGALVIKEFHEGCAVMLLFGIGDYLQSLAVSKSQDKINNMFSDADVSDEEVNSSESNLSRLENEVNGNSNTNRFLTRFSKIYTPVVFLISLLVAVIPPLVSGNCGDFTVWKEWIYRGLSALTVGCPCAIVISVPLSFYFAIGAVVKDEKNGAFYAKRAMSISRQNIAITLCVKLVILILVVFLDKEPPMWLAVFSDVGICLLAILNSLRAAVIRKK